MKFAKEYFSGVLLCPGSRALMTLVILLLIAQACSPAAPGPALTKPSPTFTSEPITRQPEPLPVALEPAPSVAASPEPTPAVLPSPSPSAPPADPSAPELIRQGAMFGSIDLYQVDEVATGVYKKDFPSCGELYVDSLPEESGEIVLRLSYATPVLPEQIEIYFGGQPGDIRRVELLNSIAGLGRAIHQNGASIRREPLAEGACAERLVLPVDIDFEVDTVIVAFENLAAVAHVGAVEMLGSLAGYVDVPVFWRVPLPGTPIDITTGQNGLVFVATEPNGLYVYDIEGNQLKQFSLPSGARLTGVAVDPFGNLAATDLTDGRFIILSPEGEQLAVGGQESYYHAAVSPVDGNLYLLKSSAISVYTTDTAELVREIPLDDIHSYVCLAFDSQGHLYTLRDYDWSATLLALDPLTGAELDALPLERTNQDEIVSRYLAIDAGGNVYILFSMNAGQIAVEMFDAQGNFVQRFGTLSSDPDGWPEGAFLDPKAITVSPDGRFILVADGYEKSAFLTAFLMEPQ